MAVLALVGRWREVAAGLGVAEEWVATEGLTWEAAEAVVASITAASSSNMAAVVAAGATTGAAEVAATVTMGSNSSSKWEVAVEDTEKTLVEEEEGRAVVDYKQRPFFN